MLDVQVSYSPSPHTALACLPLPNEVLLLYVCADTAVVLRASDLALVRVLAFWEAFPSLKRTQHALNCISIDSGLKLVVVALGSRIAAWSLSGTCHDAWRIHSTLILSPDQPIFTLDSKSGLLAVGTETGLAVYTSVLENDLPTWSQKWHIKCPTPALVTFAPSLMYIATVPKNSSIVRIYSTTSGRQTQAIAHPRPVVNICWRHSQASSRDDLILYTITSDSTLRIFLPVLDSPRTLQLHATLDLFSSHPLSNISSRPSASKIFWLDRGHIDTTFRHLLKTHTGSGDDAQFRVLKDIMDEKWDLFLRVIDDGSVILSAVANVDRRPPTLLQQFTLQYLPPQTFPTTPTPTHVHILPNPDPTKLTLVTSHPLRTYTLSPIEFFEKDPIDACVRASTGLELVAKGTNRIKNEDREIVRFVRTSEGHAVGIIRSGRAGEVWRMPFDDPPGSIEDERGRLVHVSDFEDTDFVVVLDRGYSFATYSSTTLLLTLHTRKTLSEELTSTIAVPKLESLFTYPTPSTVLNTTYTDESIFGITPDFEIVRIRIEKLTGKSRSRLNPGGKRNGRGGWEEHDVLLSVSECGELGFWVPEVNGVSTGNGSGWRCTGRVRTERKGFNRARCSSAKKTALVVPSAEGDELTIWDSMESEFASGLEYRGVFDQPILDLDWNSTPDMQSILAVGFARHVELLCQQRMTYFDQGPGWALCLRVDISGFTPYSISDSIWLSHGSFLVGSGNQMTMYGEPKLLQPRRNQSRDSKSQRPNENESLFEYVARQNGPLDDYHPQMVLQCLLWGKAELVKEIITNLAKAVGVSTEGEDDSRNRNGTGCVWEPLPVERFLEDESESRASKIVVTRKPFNLFANNFDGSEEEHGFSRSLVENLLEALETNPLPHLTPNEHAHLLVLIQATLEIDEQRRALDANGLRYLISMRSFYILNQRATSPASPSSPPSQTTSTGAVPRSTGFRERLRYRDMIWAFHSESQELLVGACVNACKGKMTWSDARALGIPVWLHSIESLKTQMEVIARNEYMAGDNRDPVVCSLFYFALGKHKLVHGLWRQAAWHKEQASMLRFLANDFNEPRWKTAALKNAFALLGKRRFEYAAAFFLLGGSLKDTVNVCVRQLGDFQLAVALARVVEQCNEGVILQGILKDAVLPIAFQTGNRWLGSWAFWLLHRRDLAVRILLTPLPDIAAAYNILVEEIGEPHYDDPSLALLFSQLRSKTLQAVKGTSEISGRSEFSFVLQMARVFCRMGCHVLALDLVRSWSFERPSTTFLKNMAQEASPNFMDPKSSSHGPSSPSATRRPVFPLESALRRRSSIKIDMDILSLPPTRSASPTRDDAASSGSKTVAHRTSPVVSSTIKEEEGDLFSRKAGLGSLMKSAKQDVQVPEFDMNAFF
ncbi:Regulator of V-ATPase in vacuolar membrane protein 1 [Leucoagaricus sp. SymC.cos]|nr:Regulator of V-ATPase in vacuolar membrane protein 1 [Leucoagaricus sp. SymC.cos]